MLEIRYLSLKYGDRLILDNINAEFEPGTINVITGLSGCGKTTMLKVLNGIIPEVNEADINGEIKYKEHDLLKESITDRAGYLSSVFQNPKTQFYCINSSDELAFGLENRNIPAEDIRHTIGKYVKLLKTEDLTDRDVFSLSGGEKQLLAITAVTCLDNDIYLFDEPSASLDREAIERFKDVLRILKEKNKIIVIAEHRLYYLRELMDNLMVLEDGKPYIYTQKQIQEEYNAIKCRHNLRRIKEISYSDLSENNITKVRLTGCNEVQNQSEDKNVLQCRDFRVCYDNPVLNISIDFEPGIYFVIGQNGVGKSTFIKRLCNITGGKGRRYYDNRKFVHPFKTISMVMQDVNYQIFTESCYDELGVATDNEQLIFKALEEVGLEDKKDVHPQVLSGGEKQRLLIAKTKVSNKPVILFDEPTSGLDVLQMKRMASYLEKFNEEGKTVIVITHDYELIKECRCRILEFIRE